MRTALITLIVSAGLAAAFGLAGAAESGRLRHVVSIYIDSNGGGMRQPEGLACTDKGVLVADTGRARLLRYSVVERDVQPVAEIQAPQLSSPIRVQVNSKDEIFVLDGKQRRIVRFHANGAFNQHVTPANVPPPTSAVPRSFKIDRADNIYLLDVFSARVLVVDRDGKYQRQVAFPPGYGFFSDLAVDNHGTIYLLDSVKAMVHAARKDASAFTPLTKALRTHLNFATSMTVDSRGVLYLVDENGGGIVLVGQDGSVLGRQLAMGWNEGLLRSPAQMCLNDKGQVFVADRGNNRVQVFTIIR
jgi:sugar lactone lactonase YvrE